MRPPGSIIGGSSGRGALPPVHLGARSGHRGRGTGPRIHGRAQPQVWMLQSTTFVGNVPKAHAVCSCAQSLFMASLHCVFTRDTHTHTHIHIHIHIRIHIHIHIHLLVFLIDHSGTEATNHQPYTPLQHVPSSEALPRPHNNPPPPQQPSALEVCGDNWSQTKTAAPVYSVPFNSRELLPGEPLLDFALRQVLQYPFSSNVHRGQM